MAPRIKIVDRDAAEYERVAKALEEADARISDLESQLLMEEQIRADAEARLAAAEKRGDAIFAVAKDLLPFIWQKNDRIAALEAENARLKKVRERLKYFIRGVVRLICCKHCEVCYLTSCVRHPVNKEPHQ